jgi:hypothetical protein
MKQSWTRKILLPRLPTFVCKSPRKPLLEFIIKSIGSHRRVSHNRLYSWSKSTLEHQYTTLGRAFIVVSVATAPKIKTSFALYTRELAIALCGRDTLYWDTAFTCLGFQLVAPVKISASAIAQQGWKIRPKRLLRSSRNFSSLKVSYSK